MLNDVNPHQYTEVGYHGYRNAGPSDKNRELLKVSSFGLKYTKIFI